jgi:hypothetical protein
MPAAAGSVAASAAPSGAPPASPDSAPETPGALAGITARARAAVARLMGETTAPAPTRPDTHVITIADTARPPHPVELRGTWYHGDRRSRLGDSSTMVLRDDGTASTIQRRYMLGGNGAWRLTLARWQGRWEVRYSEGPASVAVELCTEWRSPRAVTTCEPFKLDSLVTGRMLTFGGRYWRARPLANREPEKKRRVARTPSPS